MTIRQSRTDRERQAREQDLADRANFFSRSQLQQFDHEFKLRMLAAITSKQETPEPGKLGLGVYKHRRKAPA